MRRTWIEITKASTEAEETFGRPPCGGRGLKSDGIDKLGEITSRPPCGGRGLKYSKRKLKKLNN